MGRSRKKSTEAIGRQKLNSIDVQKLWLVFTQTSWSKERFISFLDLMYPELQNLIGIEICKLMDVTESRPRERNEYQSKLWLAEQILENINVRGSTRTQYLNLMDEAFAAAKDRLKSGSAGKLRDLTSKLKNEFAKFESKSFRVDYIKSAFGYSEEPSVHFGFRNEEPSVIKFEKFFTILIYGLLVAVGRIQQTDIRTCVQCEVVFSRLQKRRATRFCSNKCKLNFHNPKRKNKIPDDEDKYIRKLKRSR